MDNLIKNYFFSKSYRNILKCEAQSIKDEGKYHVFYNVEEITKWSSLQNNKVAEPIPYTLYPFDTSVKDALRCYCGFESIDVNYYLRNKKTLRPCLDRTSRIERIKEYIKKIDGVIEERKLNEDLLVVKWVKSAYLQDNLGIKRHVKKEDVYLDRGYLSTSMWLHYIGKYDMVPRDISKHTLFVIKVPKGTNCVYVEGHISNRDEYELLIHRGCNLIVEKTYNILFKPLVVVCRIA